MLSKLQDHISLGFVNPMSKITSADCIVTINRPTNPLIRLNQEVIKWNDIFCKTSNPKMVEREKAQREKNTLKQKRMRMHGDK